jgi:hypothetical protein
MTQKTLFVGQRVQKLVTIKNVGSVWYTKFHNNITFAFSNVFTHH